ncbi:hypothetical protein [Tropicibacter oceani]|uniref:Glycerophosphoryl diester phosphodiesterase membrane domain-containing protein n=1 Tax=Tropicibacter oceani TaxID=3058420 RepID=A0ABY8QJB2_9RHOB|nr:hypothetical protein [Tropicibacter oceani]WGW04600.1 hypothetical protein QF118_03345 [Tropicibacter oceani]
MRKTWLKGQDMKGWTIFVHSLRMVLRNWMQALRIGLLPVIIATAALSLLVGGTGWEMMNTPGGGMPMPEDGAGFTMAFLPAWIVIMVAMIWIVVNWHRFVLLEEYPRGWLPPFPVSLILGYFGRILMLVVIAVVLSIPLGILVAAMGQAAMILLPIFWVIIMVGFYRVSVILPAGAVGKPMTLGQAWTATQGASGVILTFALILFAANFVLQLGVAAIMAVSVLLGGLVSIAFSLVMGLVGVSILTTLYGHYVEGREID